jgi:hypothetical protein
MYLQEYSEHNVFIYMQVGLAITQDQQLRFVVEGVAPGGGAEEEGTIQVRDRRGGRDGGMT